MPKLPPDTDGYGSWGFSIHWPTLRCKHGPCFRCDRCGVTERRDAMHTTRGGRGVVGQLDLVQPVRKKTRPKRSRQSKAKDRRGTIR